MTVDPYYDALLAAQASPGALAKLMPSALMAKLAPTLVPDPTYVPGEVALLRAVAQGPHGDVALNVYRPSDLEPDAAVPLVVWCHGGGWVEGGHDTPDGDGEAIELCHRLGAVVVSPDYHLALAGIHHPLPLDDVLAAWHHALEQATSWGADPTRTALGGGSAGGNLAAGAALMLRDAGATMPRVLVLNVPPLHALLPELTDQERRELALAEEGEATWRVGLRLGFENYAGAPVDEIPAYVAPGSGNLAGLPPTLLITCEYDVLRASARVFAASLQAHGVEHKLVVCPGVGHGHTTMPWLPAAKETYTEIAAWVAGA